MSPLVWLAHVQEQGGVLVEQLMSANSADFRLELDLLGHWPENDIGMALCQDREMADPIRVLYVAGWSYTGSTLLGRILGELEDVFMGGELCNIWSYGFLDDKPCTCGEPFSRCPLWRAVVAEAFGTGSGLDAERIAHLNERLLRVRRVPQLLLRSAGLGTRANELRAYRDHLDRLYRAIARVAGVRVVVDTSKSSEYASVLAQVRDLDLRVVHMTRDARGMIHSLSRRSNPEVGRTLALALYDFWHVSAELRWRPRGSRRYLRLRYEDFVGEPERGVRRAMALAGLPDARLPFERPNRVVLKPGHQVAGNRNRFASGPVDIVLDDEWRVALTRRERVLAATLAWPLLLRHGYLGRPNEDPEQSSVRSEHSA